MMTYYFMNRSVRRVFKTCVSIIERNLNKTVCEVSDVNFRSKEILCENEELVEAANLQICLEYLIRISRYEINAKDDDMITKILSATDLYYADVEMKHLIHENVLIIDGEVM